MKRIIQLVLLIVITAGCSLSRPTYVYDIPENYTGWIYIQFEKPDALPLPMQGGKLVLEIGKDGKLTTSSNLIMEGKDEFYYVGDRRIQLEHSGLHGGGHIWAESSEMINAGTNVLKFIHFFVGTESQYAAEGRRVATMK